MRPPEIFKFGKNLKITRMLIKRTIDCYLEAPSIKDKRLGRFSTFRIPKTYQKFEGKISEIQKNS